MNEKGEYDFSKLGMVDFVKEYEEIMSARAQEAGDTKRKAYLGRPLDAAVKYLAGSTKSVNQKMFKYWAQSVVRDNLKVEDMKRITDNCVTALTQPGVKPQQLTKEQHQQLSNIIAAKEAMVEVRKSRWWLWKIIYRKQNNMEKEYLASLKTQMDNFAVRKYPVSEVLLEIGTPVMKQELNNLDKYLAAEKEKPQVDNNAVNNVDNNVVDNKANAVETLNVKEANIVDNAPMAKPVSDAPTANAPVNTTTK